MARRMGRHKVVGMASVAIFGLGLGVSQTTAFDPVPVSAITDHSEHVLRYEYQVQETGYWCSAAAVQIALSVNGVSVEQESLATEMEVTPEIGLPVITNLEETLEEHSGGFDYTVRQWANYAQLYANLKKDVISNVTAGRAVVINVIRIAESEFPGGHYATIVGYRDAGREYLVADPANAERGGVWLAAHDVAEGIKLNRYVI